MLLLDRLALLSAIVGLAVIAGCLGRTGAHEADRARLQMEQVEVELLAFKLKYGRFPTPEEGLGATGGGDLLQDPWGNALVYATPSRDGQQEYELICLGADGHPGGDGLAADLSSWDE